MEAAEASSPSAEGEIPFLALLFCELFSCAYIVKRKAANRFVLFHAPLFCNRVCQCFEPTRIFRSALHFFRFFLKKTIDKKVFCGFLAYIIDETRNFFGR
ncbi:MAG: hypothetical protein IKA05_02405 [Clostridia bacterium]|nr:hypothetical protein [Clostridia bacterium]